ncbi:MAG: hypothetical protein AB7E37_06710, partial [Candidatus Altimarinota bacterium]
MTITLDENELKKLVNNAVVGILDTLRMTKKEGNFESLPLCHKSSKSYSIISKNNFMILLILTKRGLCSLFNMNKFLL